VTGADLHPVVGVWLVTAPDAPFARHVMTFHADGTMLQSNPPQGNKDSSDSAGMGVWVAEGPRVRGRFAEVSADLDTHAFSGTTFVRFTLEVDGDALRGTARTTSLGPDDAARQEASTTDLDGYRLTVD
jgi:hypothetical protein